MRKELTPIKLRAKAAKFAKATVKTQMESFKVAISHDFYISLDIIPMKDILFWFIPLTFNTCGNTAWCLQRFGVWADWNNPYLTLDPEYEAAQVMVPPPTLVLD